MIAPALSDGYGRTMRKLRVSLTDACNFRCFYCMPDGTKFMPRENLLSHAELLRLSGALVGMGIREVRLTGGEPTLRDDFEPIVEGFSQMPLQKLGLTTNGFQLGRQLPFLARTHCRNINVSLDSLQRGRFELITKSKFYVDVLDGIYDAKERGLNVKVNVVVARGINDDELLQFVEWSERLQIPVRFLELMRIGPQIANHAGLFVSAAEMMQRIETERVLAPVAVPHDSTALVYRTENGGELGFIASETRPFCHDCSRLRLSATGVLRACLMAEAGADLRAAAIEEIPAIVARVVAMKPLGRLAECAQPMYQIGG